MLSGQRSGALITTAPSGLRIAFAGTPEFAVPALRALVGPPRAHELVGVLTQPDRPSGRGREITASAVKRAALASGLPIAQPQTLRTAEGRAALESWRPDLLIVVAYGLILPPEVLALPRLGCINIHASLLPRWRGAAPIQRALLAGDALTGVTFMRMDAGLDTGPILLQRTVPIERGTTSGELHDILARLGAAALLGAIAELAAGRLEPRAQPAEGASYAAKIEKREALIDWRASALEIERRVCAFNPWPIAETRLAQEPLRIFRALAEPRRAASGAPDHGATLPGTIVEAGPERVVVQCGDGLLAITELQRPGRKALPASEFLRAVRLSAGERLG